MQTNTYRILEKILITWKVSWYQFHLIQARSWFPASPCKCFIRFYQKYFSLSCAWVPAITDAIHVFHFRFRFEIQSFQSLGWLQVFKLLFQNLIFPRFATVTPQCLFPPIAWDASPISWCDAGWGLRYVRVWSDRKTFNSMIWEFIIECLDHETVRRCDERLLISPQQTDNEWHFWWMISDPTVTIARLASIYSLYLPPAKIICLL